MGLMFNNTFIDKFNKSMEHIKRFNRLTQYIHEQQQNIYYLIRRHLLFMPLLHSSSEITDDFFPRVFNVVTLIY